MTELGHEVAALIDTGEHAAIGPDHAAGEFDDAARHRSGKVIHIARISC